MAEAQMSSPQAQVVGQPGSVEGLRQRSPSPPADHFGMEDDSEVFLQQEPLSQREQKLAMGIGASCVFDLAGSAVICITAWKYAYLDNGVSLWCLGLQALSHWLSSCLLLGRIGAELWPYSEWERGGAESEATLLRERRRSQLYREQALSTIMGLVMLVSCCALLFKAARKMKFWNVWYRDHTAMDTEAEVVTEWLAWVGFGIYSLQAVARMVGCCTLRMATVSNACVVSIVSLLFLFVLGFAASYEKEWSWKAEPIAAVVLALVMLVEGIRVIIAHFDDMDTRLKFDNRA